MDTYSWLRAFADSWWLAGMMAFFIGVVLFTLRPGSSAVHREIANIPLRDDLPEPRGTAEPRPACPTRSLVERLVEKDLTDGK